jgi:hypothetical protein
VIIVLLALWAVIAIPNIPLRKAHMHVEPVAEPGEGADGVLG